MLERLKRRLELVGNDRDELLGDLLEEAEQYILGYTGRRVLPMALECAVTIRHLKKLKIRQRKALKRLDNKIWKS